MASNSEDFKILLGATFDTKDIQTKLNNMKNLKVNVNVDLTGLDKVKKTVQETVNAAQKNVTALNKTAGVSGSSKAFSPKTYARNLSKIQQNMLTGKYETDVNKLETGFKRIGVSAQVAEQHMRGVKAAFEEMQGATGHELVDAQAEFNVQLQTSRNVLKNMRLEASKVSDSLKTAKLSTDLQNKLTLNGAMDSEAQGKLKSYVKLLDSGTKSQGQRQTIRKWADEIVHEQRKEGKLGKSEVETFAAGAKKFLEWGVASTAVMQVANSVREIYHNVVDLDSAMIELEKVSDATGAELNKAFSISVKSAKDLGASVKDVINATADWARLGYSLPDSEQLAQVATVYKNVGDGIDLSQANESLVSTLQGFQLDAGKAMEIIDKFNEVANNFPIDSGGIGEALQRSAASFYAANTDLSKSIALITGANSVLQDPESVGTMWKTVSARIRGADSELKDMGEDTEGMVESSSKLQALVKGITGFDIMKDENTYKDIYEIIVGIGERWQDISDINQASLLEALAGKRQSNALSAALNNIDMIKEAYAAAEGSAGSAMREQETYEKSVQYSLDRLTATFEGFSATLLDSGVVKFFVDLGTQGVKALEGITNALTPTGVLGMGVGILAGAKDFGLFKVINSSADKARKTIGFLGKDLVNIKQEFTQATTFKGKMASIFSPSQGATPTDPQIQLVQEWNEKIEQNALDEQARTEILKDANATQQEYFNGLNGTAANVNDLANAENAATQSTMKLRMANIALNTALSIGVSLAIQGIVYALKEWVFNIDTVREHAEDALEAYKSSTEQLQTTKKSIDDIAGDYAKLAQGVDEFGHNVSLNADEQERYHEITNKIADMFPEMVKGYDTEGNAIIRNKGNVDALTEAYERQTQAAKDALLLQSDDVFTNFKNQTGTSFKSNLFSAFKSVFSLDDAFAQSDIEYLKNLLENPHDLTRGNPLSLPRVERSFKDAGILDSTVFATPEDVAKAVQDHPQVVQSIIDNLEAEAQTQVQSVKDVVTLYLEKDSTYTGLTEEQKEVVSSFISTLDTEFFSEYDSASGAATGIVERYIKPLQDSGLSDAIHNSLSLGTTLQENKITIGDYYKQIDDLYAHIAELPQDEQSGIRYVLNKLFGDIDIDVAPLVQNVKNKLSDEFDDNVGSLTFGDLEIASKLEIPEGTLLSWDELIDKINEYKKSNPQAIVVSSMLQDEIDNLQSAYTAMTDAVKEYNNEGYISVDTYQSLLEVGSDYLRYLFDENGNLRMDATAVRELTIARIQDLAAQQKQKLLDMASAWENEAAAQQYLAKTIGTTTSAYEQQIQAQLTALKMKWLQDDNWSEGTVNQALSYLTTQFEGIDNLTNATINGITQGFGMAGQSATDTTDKISDLTDKLDELDKKQHLAALQYDIDKASLALEQFNTKLEVFDTLADLTSEHDFASRLENVRNQFTVTTQQGLALRGELERLISVSPQTAEEYNAIASQMEQVGKDYFDAVKQQRDLRQELLDTKAETLEYFAKSAADSTSKAVDTLSDAFDIVENGSLSGGLFSQTLLPDVTKDAVDKQREENDKLIAEEQRYRDALADIRKKALEVEHEEELADFDKEREELNQEIAEAQNEAPSITVDTNIAPVDTSGLQNDINNIQNGLNSNPLSIPVTQQIIQGKSPRDIFSMQNNSQWNGTNIPRKADGGATAGNVYVNEGIGSLRGQEAMILPDGTFRLIGNGKPSLVNVPKGTQILNAKDTADILAHTGIKDGDRIERYADGTTHVISRAANGTSSQTRSIRTAKDFALSTIEELNQAFDDVKSEVSLETLKTEFYRNLSDPLFYDTMKEGLTEGFDTVFQDPDIDLCKVILSNTDWKSLPQELQQTLKDNNVSFDNWEEWIADSDNAKTTMQLMQNSGLGSWDLLSPTVQELLESMGIDGVKVWDEFVEKNPLQALQLLATSWKTLADTIQQWLNDCITIGQNGKDAIHNIQIEAPTISEQSWTNLQTLIANKIQEVLNVINQTFGNNTVDLNFAIDTQLAGSEQSNPQGITGTSDSNNAIVNTAQKFLGVPYVWGGTSPSGFDCSGLMQYVFAQNGIVIPRTSQEQSRAGVPVGKSELQPGDMVFFSNEGLNDHVGMYIGNGQFIHAPHTGDVVKISDLNSAWYTQHYSGARRVTQYASGTQDYGIAGENYKREWAINKRTGQWTLIKSPTLFNKKEYDIVGEKVSEQIDKPINTYAKGTLNLSSIFSKAFGNVKKSSKTTSKDNYPAGVTIDVPDGLGKYYTYMNWNAITNMDTAQGKLIKQAGRNYDSEGYGRVGERYALAMTSTFGSIGDYVDVYMADGRVIHGILADEKSQTYTPWDHNPANKWGHNNGQSIVEFVTNWVGHNNPPGNGGVIKVVNVGNYFGNPSFAGQTVGYDNSLTAKLGELRLKLQKLTGITRTNTHTGQTTVAGYKSLGDIRQSGYDFDATFTSHANGTNGYHIAGENGKPELVIDKRTKKVSLIDTPTLFDPAKADVIGEHDTAKLNKSLNFYENGTVDVTDDNGSAEEIAGYLKTINEHLADGELADGTYTVQQLKLLADSVSEIEGDEKINLDKLDSILDFETNFEDFEKSLDDLTDSIDHYSKDYTDKWYDEMGRFIEESDDVVKEIQEWRKGGTTGDESLTKFDEISERATEVVDGHLRNLVNLDIENAKNQMSILNELSDKAQALYNSASTADEQERAIEVIEEIREQQDTINDNFNKIMEQERDLWVSEIDRDDLEHTSNTTWIDAQLDDIGDKLDRTTSAVEKSALLQEEKNLYDQKAAEAQARMNSAHENANRLRADAQYADLFANIPMDEIFDANGEFNEQYYDTLKQLAADPNSGELTQRFITAAEILKTAGEAWHNGNEDYLDAIREGEDILTDMGVEKVEAYADVLSRINEIENIRLSKQQALISATEQQNNLSQSLRDTMASITEELDANKHLSQWLDEDTRKLLFNDEDFAEMQDSINSIQAQADKLYKDYRADIAALDETEYFKQEQITAEYERQMEVLNEQLTTSQKKLDVAKKQLEYDNAAKQRDTRIILGGRAVQVANPDTLYNLAKEKANLEADYNNTLITNQENEVVRDQERVADSINREIAAREKMVDLISDMTDAEKMLWAEGLPTLDELSTILNNLDSTDYRWLNEHSHDFRQEYMSLSDKERNVGYNLTNDYDAQHQIIDPLLQAGILPYSYGYALHHDSGDRHNDKATSDLNTMKYAQTENYHEKHYTSQGIENNDVMLASYLNRYKGGNYSPVTGNNSTIDSMVAANIKNTIMEPALNMGRSLANSLDKFTQNVQNSILNKNDASTQVNNHFSGDIIVTETIDNASDFLDDMTRQASDRWDITKNMKR